MTAVEFIEPLTHEEGVSQATKLFVDTYGAAPEGVWAAPGRVNLIGEHTDYNAGLCLPIALPHRTFIALKPREDTKVRVKPASTRSRALTPLSSPACRWALA